MKVRITTLLLAAATLGACTTRPVQPSFEIMAIDTLVGSPTSGYNVEYRFASITNTDKSPALDAIERANINYFFELEEFAGSAQEAQTKAIEQIAQMILPGEFTTPDGSPGDISAESEGAVVDSLLCYTIIRSSYTGGAHGMYRTECHTYSLASGDERTALELFGEERATELAMAIRQKLYTEYEVTNDAELAAQGFYPDCIDITDNFQITPSGITFIYNAYEIGCYALGPIEVSFSTQELQTR